MKTLSIMKRLLFLFVLSAVLLITGSVKNANAATTYDISKKNIVISKSGSYIITGHTDKYTLQVAKGVSANITLKNVSIIGRNDMTNATDLLDLKSGATVNLILIGDNTIQNNYMGAAIHVPYGAKLMISAKSTGSLSAISDCWGAGIGGSQTDVKGGTGTIVINGGTVIAKGGYEGCGIGGGTVIREDMTVYESKYTGGGDIRITGGKVTAVGGEGGVAGIGGTSLTRQGKITITGGEVTASSLEAGIGGEAQGGKGNLITISGGIVKAYGNNYAAAIGNHMDPAGTTVTITGGMVAAKGDYGKRTIYEAYVSDNMIYGDSLKAYDIAAEKITISGGDINAYTFSEQPINPEGKKVYPCFINCGKGSITSITFGKKSYGAQSVVSGGYLHLFLPSNIDMLTIKSGNKKLYNDYFWAASDPLWGIERQPTLSVDIGKSDVELIDGGCIYNQTVYRCDNITVTGTTTENQILVHTTKRFKQSIVFKELSVDYAASGAQDFIIIDNDVTVDIHLDGINEFLLGDEARGIFVGNDASLCFSGEDDNDAFAVTAGNKAKAFYTNIGNVIQYGGTLKFTLGDGSAAIYTGNFGTFTLCGGTFEAHNTTGSAIAGLHNLQVNVYGGTLLADTIGDFETANEEVSNKTVFTMTGGEVKVEDRIIFREYKIYGGVIGTRILGCGTGSNVWVYGGSLEIGAYIDYEGGEWNPDINMENILGGSINQRNDVPEEELNAIKTDLC